MAVARATSDLRALETALRTYKIDHAAYPEGSALTPQLTTPVAYLVGLPADPFAEGAKDSAAAWYRYASDGTYYLVWSIGPDRTSQLFGLADIDAGLEALVPLTYDPSNGTSSQGDVFRTNLGREDEEPVPAKDLSNIPCP